MSSDRRGFNDNALDNPPYGGIKDQLVMFSHVKKKDN